MFRQWEWRSLSPRWSLRTDGWTCIRCEGELADAPAGVPQYAVARPALDASVIAYITEAEAEAQVVDVRVRAGDPSTRSPLVCQRTRSSVPADTE